MADVERASEGDSLRASDFDYDLPPELIAQTPAEPRDAARLMVASRRDAPPLHAIFRDLPRYLQAGDVLVANRSRVLPGRLLGRLASGSRAELLLLRRVDEGLWEALGRPGRRLRPGSIVMLAGEVTVRVESWLEHGHRLVRFLDGAAGEARALAHGQVPLPPYIRGWQGDPERYQTIFADVPGSAAAPTAGLHMTPTVLNGLAERGVEVRFVILHVGVDTFRPVQVERVADHSMHAEYYEVPAETATALAAAKREGRRIVALGTTVVRTLETIAPSLCDQPLAPAALSGWTRLFIVPGYTFRLVDALITNFHLPRSTLLMLVSAFAGRERIRALYEEAIRQRYRFYSFGDAMLLF